MPAKQVIVAAGADALIGYVCQAVLDPGDEAVIPWPSFPSFVRDAQKRDAIPVLVPLVEGAVEVEALRAAVTPRTRLLFLATPNNPTGLEVSREDAVALVRELPDHVLAVVDEAYFDYLEPGTGLDTIADLVRAGDDAIALRTFSKLYGLAGLRVGYAVGPPAVVAAMRKVQRGYDVGALAQVAALASLADADEAAETGGEQGRDGDAHRDRGRARIRAVRRQQDEFRPRRRRFRCRRGGGSAAPTRCRRPVRDAVRGAHLAADRSRLAGGVAAPGRGTRSLPD